MPIRAAGRGLGETRVAPGSGQLAKEPATLPGGVDKRWKVTVGPGAVPDEGVKVVHGITNDMSSLIPDGRLGAAGPRGAASRAVDDQSHRRGDTCYGEDLQRDGEEQ